MDHELHLSGRSKTKVPDTVREGVLAALSRLAVRPGPVLQLLEADPHDPRQIARAIGREPGIAARVVGVANSAWFALRTSVTSCDRAVLYLGPTRARALGLAFGLKSLGESCGIDPVAHRTLWIQSLCKASAASILARHVLGDDGSDAFLVGLLQDLALPILWSLDPDFYTRMLTENLDRQTWQYRERNRFGLDHSMAAAHLLDKWRLPVNMIQEVRFHHRPPSTLRPEIGIDQLPGFLAGLLSHAGELPSERQWQWLGAIHARFLGDAYASPDAFIEAATAEASALHNTEHDTRAEASGPDLPRCIAEVSRYAIDSVTQLHKLEHSLSQQRKDLSSLKLEAMTDPLCKVLNRRGFIKLAKSRLEHAAQTGRGACLMMIDLDHFKPVNDQHGHAAGDRMLRGVAKLLRRSVDRTDLIGRIGGDEFSVLVAGVSVEEARAVTRRVATHCIGSKVRLCENLDVTVRFSLGAVAREDLSTVNFEQFLAQADQAMYARKRGDKCGLLFRVIGADGAIRAEENADVQIEELS